jgi:hypothetical protein
MTKTNRFSLISNIKARDNEGGEGGSGEGGEGGEGVTGGEGGSGGDKTFTQEQVNAMMADQKKKIKAQNAEIVEQLQGQLEGHKGTAAEKQALQDRIKTLKQEHMTAAERAASKHSEAIQAMQVELEASNKRGDTGWELYRTARSSTEVLEAATAGEAIQAGLVKDVLNPFTSLEEATNDDGQPTGEFEVKVTMPVTDSEGKTKVQVLSPVEAVAAMKKMDKYAPLFKSTATGGTGGKNSGDGKGGQLTDSEYHALAQTDPAAFQREYRRRQGLETATK